MESVTRITIVGAGPAGLAFAVDCERRGIEALVYTHKDHQRTRTAIEKRGYLVVRGLIESKAQIRFTSDPQEAAGFSTLFVICLRGDAHANVWQQFEGVDLSAHLVLFIPGSFATHLIPRAIRLRSIFQASSTPLSTISTEDGGIYVGGKKTRLTVAGSPAKYRNMVQAVLNTQVDWALNDLDVMTLNPSGIFHPPVMIGNAHRIAAGEDFAIYADGLTADVIAFTLDSDAVRCRIREVMGLAKVGEVDVLNRLYAANYRDLEHVRDQWAMYAVVKAPKTLRHRMLVEDVRIHWVLWYEIAQLLGLDAAPLRQGIQRAAELIGEDFFKTGMTLEKLGLGGVSREMFFSKYAARGAGLHRHRKDLPATL